MVIYKLPACFFPTTLGLWFRLTHTAASRSPLQIIPDDTPRRALMYCPGDDMRKINKGINSKADCIALDCEDGVAINRKKEARATIRSVLDAGNLPKRPEVGVRVNAVDSGLCEDDLSVILSASNPPAALYLPKVESRDNLLWFAEKLDKYLVHNVTVKLVIFAESARAIMDLPEICKAAMELSQNHKLVPVGLVFGSDDLCASIGAARSVDGGEIMYARQRLVLVAKAFGLQAVDMVHIQYKDLDSLRQQSEAGARLGYTGKQVIHPDQIEIVQKAFLPSREQLQWARDVVDGFRASQQQGKGAFVHAGSMVDMPLLRQAENIIRLSGIDQNS
ncbi:citramalyl-CoA lyase, mitochondrial-like [Homalodisca vitripennis]|uniref:citramalyl-CoA lyase, mitochondrial-like n=1 Tax=Homalodisca vitripennis TaxID=197043 RepID=UPI001EEC4863|nr:citramalyl-CoA lyase, mitochondrial-like [Homalodisca vitripennis]XP_046668732.1 citramalyl-CoA lyase, mitochondrial-like [Homalodisca vitripennis]XP_046668733.1 citramalyl-CoA lyase, mitochondrial-like [Homalodisca vitripennis]XP_046668734.1 citramalyl-CoA lyase, mitochondrial-like [Homalodisca vitripennis]XP_046668736.1 citramalyl-CoA lyase, mitochondrial-like [Homalodisca vitripennis]XP_046668737.1 citramalyl-CoA lyase, mitochondrial-like [Homalodisca vitripennis]